ncbi:DUF1569 domain-containing protein [Hyunsoonleella pacifica]|uniref:DUF1569 domain-containing protein n=1 Tax=Hyunsoonleella pacifica TaxID=1080224 RepID=A0A4Q9FN57_9FLAO|nr:DUF1569 domain-containing protein [Hyunsoonleella pacifica]TBN15788.1 DUF1569 domain-containing protein [Hyunsoonleella pacifica]GGD22664.1 hypothetical protein GCM10011368_25900 [Hyunsoonleella pacifica]
MPNTNIKKLRVQLSQIEAFMPHFRAVNTSVSKVSVGWQLDHSLKVINGVFNTMANSNPKHYKRNFNLSRIILFSLNYIPRGNAKSPKIVVPPNTILEKDLEKQLHTAKRLLDGIGTLDEAHHFKHFIFGTLSKKQTLRFLRLHTHHHLKIIGDILK